jgi:hypothetical protein
LIGAVVFSVLALTGIKLITFYGCYQFQRDTLSMKMMMFLSVFCLVFADLSMIVVVLFGFKTGDMILPLFMLMASAAFQKLLYETRRRGWIFMNQRNIRRLSSFNSVLLWWWIASSNVAIVLAFWQMALDWLRIWIHYIYKRYLTS